MEGLPSIDQEIADPVHCLKCLIKLGLHPITALPRLAQRITALKTWVVVHVTAFAL